MFNPENPVNPEKPVNPENSDSKNNSRFNQLRANIHAVCEDIKDCNTDPKEWTEEYERLTNFLEEKVWEWDKKKESFKYWNVKKVKTAIRMIEEWIINKENIKEDWEGMDRWSDKNIQTAKKLADMWMEIVPSDYKNMRHRNEKKFKTAEKLVSEEIIKIKHISNNWAYMDKWNDTDIETAKKLHDLWMEIKWSDQEYMKKWTAEEINNLKEFKEKNGNSLDYIDFHPELGNETQYSICAIDYDRFKGGIPTSLLAK